MPTSVDLNDSEGFLWDIGSDIAFGLNLENGTNDAFDLGMRLRVNGTVINGAFSVDGREVNMVPQLVGGVAVTRSILVSDASISTTGFARFLESFTNTTDETITITVETITNSGADDLLQFTATSSGDTTLTAADTGFVTDDDNTAGGDSAVMIAYGDGTLLPTSATVTEEDEGSAIFEVITVTHTLTLAPGETQSLLQFAAQSTTAGEGNGSLSFFASADPLFEFDGLLTGLTDAERNSVVNYSNVAAPPSATLVDSDGNRWGIGSLGGLSTLDNDALQNFSMLNLFGLSGTAVLESITENPAEQEVTVVTRGDGVAENLTVTSTYRVLEGQGVVRLVVTLANDPFGGFDTSLAVPTAEVVTGAGPALLVSQISSPEFGAASGVVLDDSESGSGGTLPALTFVFGATDSSTVPLLTGSTFTSTLPVASPLEPGDTRSFLFFFALNDSGLAALADLARLNTPGPEALIGLSSNQVFGLDNFFLGESDRLQQILGFDSLDEVLTGNAWGDSIVGLGGNDSIAALGSDDFVSGDGGEDDIDGGDGADTLFGGSGDDAITAGNGADEANGDAGNDVVLGLAGDDLLAGGTGNDTLFGGVGADTMAGAEDNDALSGGGGNDSLEGSEGDDTLDGGLGRDAMAGGVGSDVFIVDNARDTVIESSADAGTDEVRSSVNFTIRGTQSIEAVTLTGTANLRATGNDSANLLTGNAGNNRLTGNDGADTLDGGIDGFDTLIGGRGGDVYILGNRNAVITETATGTGIDEIRISGSYGLGVQFIELITLTGTDNTFATGTGAAERIVGNTGFNTLSGLAGADTLEGGDGDDALNGGTEDDRMFGGNGLDFLFGGEGADSLDGGAGDDFMVGEEGADTLIGGLGDDTLSGGTGAADVGDRMFGGEGNDEMSGSAGIDVLDGGEGDDILFGGSEADSLFGDDGDDVLNGGTGADSLFGGAGADTLQGGEAADTGINRLFGGDGSDSYIVTSTNDRVTEEPADGGVDTVSATVSHTLTANVENLILLETGTNLNGTGNAGANQLTGNANDNILDGAGGDDRMAGGNGNDTYIVSEARDVVTEANGTVGGIDIVQSSVSFVLGANVETLLLTGTAAINGTGNTAANTITGNAQANVIDGGAGNDTMTGGAGSDLYFVADAGDVVIETGGTAGGLDTVQSRVTFTLGDSVENLTLAGNTVIDGTGNAAANSLTGNNRNNVLDGGLGADTMTGFGGNDTFVFRTALGAANIDTIVDFVQGTDRIHLENAVFTALASGGLAARAFVNGTAALDGNDRILYDSATGNLFYDADGDGAGAAVQFAVIANNAALTSASFLVI